MQARRSPGNILEKPFIVAAWLLLFFATITLSIYWSPPLQRIFYNLLPVLQAFFFLVSFTGFGAILARILPRNSNTDFVSYAALGIGATGLFIYFAGLAGFLTRAVLLGWTLSGFILFALVFLRRWRPALALSPLQSWSAFGIAVLAVFILQGIPFVVAPEVSTDALEYHLMVPKAYLATKHIGYIPGLVESNYPSLAEYNYTVILGLTNEIVCKCFHFWIGIMVLVAIAKLSRKADPTKPSSVAPAIFYSLPVVAIVSGWAWNDLLFTLFIVLGLCYFIDYHLHSDTSSLLYSGILWGLASCTKYTFVMVFLAMMLLFLIGIYVWEWKWKHLLLLVLPVGVLSLVWFAKNWFFTGNPFYPFLNTIFRSPHWNDAAHQYFLQTFTDYELGRWNWSTYLLAPFLVTLKPRIVDAYIGILPIALLPLVFVKTHVRAIGLLKGFVLCYVAVWLLIRTPVRSLFPLLAVLCVIYSVALQKLNWNSRIIRTGFVLLLSVSVVLNFFMTLVTTYFLFDPIRNFIGKESRAQYRTRMSRGQPAYDFLNRQPDLGSVLLVSIHNPLYLRAEPVFSSCCDPPVAETFAAGANTADQVRDRLFQRGVTHIVFSPGDYAGDLAKGLYTWNAGSRRVFEEFLLTRCEKLGIFQGDVVLRILPPKQAR